VAKFTDVNMTRKAGTFAPALAVQLSSYPPLRRCVTVASAFGAVKLTPKQEFKAVGDVALLAASPHLEHQVSANWSEKNEKVLEDWKKDVAEKIKECDAHAKYQVRGL
jgi:hypothetical protein